MAKRITLEMLDQAIREAAAFAGPSASTRKIAEDFYTHHADLIEPFAEEWVIEKLAALIRKYRAKARRAANPQLAFEGMLGFSHLPARMERPDGETVPRSDATMNVLRHELSRRGQKETAAERELRQAIILMSKYTPENQRITWGQVVEREAGKG